jgi:deoxyribodipyrimidine photo-lyase
MRSLAATGWLNFRMRAMVMAVASYHLRLDWRQSGLVLARLFTDYEPGIHWPQVQMQSGTTGTNIPRIYNPVKQGHDQDPDGAFIRRWLPELAALPTQQLHQPWLAPPEVIAALAYPAPFLGHEDAARAARAAITAIRHDPGHVAPARAILARHGSRKAGLPDANRRRAAAKPGPGSGQGVLDL